MIAFALSATPASATYSITAVDTRTREVGGSGASCVPYEVIRIYAGIPNRGAVNGQANLDDKILAAAAARLREGWDAAAVLAEVTSTAVFPQADKMQWGIVDVNGGVAHATGSAAPTFAGDQEGRTADGRYAFSTQGNILTSARVLERASTGFLSGGCDLAERLVLALEAAGSQNEGDSRCTRNGYPAASAYVEVTGTSGTIFRVSVPDVSPQDPTPFVRRAFDEYRAAHPCPVNQPSAPSPRTTADATGCTCATQPSSSRSAAWLVALATSLWSARRRLTTSRQKRTAVHVGKNVHGES